MNRERKKKRHRKRKLQRGKDRVRKRVCGVIWKVVVGRSRDEGLAGSEKGDERGRRGGRRKKTKRKTPGCVMERRC